jgi:hypothetical protein
VPEGWDFGNEISSLNPENPYQSVFGLISRRGSQ